MFVFVLAKLCKLFYTILQFTSIVGLVQYTMCESFILPIGLRCAFVGAEQHDEAVMQSVVSGEYQLVYMSPESLLGILQWREMFRSPVYQECLVAIAVDEAHLVEKW